MATIASRTRGKRQFEEDNQHDQEDKQNRKSDSDMVRKPKTFRSLKRKKAEEQGTSTITDVVVVSRNASTAIATSTSSTSSATAATSGTGSPHSHSTSVCSSSSMEQKKPSESREDGDSVATGTAGGKINCNQSFDECKPQVHYQIRQRPTSASVVSMPLPSPSAGTSKQPSSSQMSVPFETDVLFSEKELVESVYGLYKSISYNTLIPKGKPKSGRKWKTEQTTRFSDVKKDKPLKTSWEKKMKEKAEKKSIKMYERQLKESREQEIQKKKERKANKLKRKLENERKSEVVQVIRNTAKLKRMKKKQLRQLEKR